MFCKDCMATREADRPLYSLLNRATALSKTCRALAGVVRRDEALVESTIAACREQAGRAQRPDPERLEALRSEEEKLGRRIRSMMDNPGETEQDLRETNERIRALRRKRAEVSSTLARAEADAARPIVIPEESEVRGMIDGLAGLLESAASGPSGEDARAAREAVELLTGGRIDLEQMGERRRHGPAGTPGTAGRCPTGGRAGSSSPRRASSPRSTSALPTRRKACSTTTC
jgi:hypothetical protein